MIVSADKELMWGALLLLFMIGCLTAIVYEFVDKVWPYL